MPDRRTLLHQTADLAADFLEGLPSRPVHATASHDDLLAAFDGDLPARGEAAGEIVVGPRPDRRSGADRQRRTALLRVRDRRQPAVGARGGLADERLGQQRRALRDRSVRVGRRGGRRPLADRPVRAAGRVVDRVLDRRDDGLVHGPGRRPPSRPRADSAGTSRRTALPARPRSRSSSAPRRTSRSTSRSRCSGSAGTGSIASRPTSRAGCAPIASARCSPGCATGR